MSDAGQTQEWVNGARRGDSLAVSKLLAGYHPVLRARVERKMDHALKARMEPEDILQQVYLEIFRGLDRFEGRGPDSFLNWALTIVDSKMADAARALHRQVRDIARELRPGEGVSTQSYLNLLDRLCVDAPTPSRVVRREEAVGALMACISGLSEAHERVIRLRFLEGRPVAEVAARMSKSEAAVVALTKRALDALRGAMEGMGEFTRGA